MRFADTSYFLALLNDDDAWHSVALDVSEELVEPLITTDWVLAELANTMSKRRHRVIVASFLKELRQEKEVRLVEASRTLFDRGFDLFARRRDKEWSLTDCISFEVMADYKITGALTTDHHFAQAGFDVLLQG